MANGSIVDPIVSQRNAELDRLYGLSGGPGNPFLVAAYKKNPALRAQVEQNRNSLYGVPLSALDSSGASAPQAAYTPYQPINTADVERFSQQAGNQLYELQRRRLAALGQGQRQNLSRFYAGRGGGASSAAAVAARRQQEAERTAIADASLQSQLAGRQLGIAEAQRLQQQNQFGASLNQATNLANLQARLGAGSQGSALAQQLLAFHMQQQAQKKQQQGALVGNIFKGAGAIGGFFLGGPPGAAAGAQLGGAVGDYAGPYSSGYYSGAYGPGY